MMGDDELALLSRKKIEINNGDRYQEVHNKYCGSNTGEGQHLMGGSGSLTLATMTDSLMSVLGEYYLLKQKTNKHQTPNNKQQTTNKQQKTNKQTNKQLQRCDKVDLIAKQQCRLFLQLSLLHFCCPSQSHLQMKIRISKKNYLKVKIKRNA